MEALSQLAKLGARLIIQRAVEDEFDAWLGRARYERRPEAPAGSRNGFRRRTVQTAEGELSVEIPQVREAAAPFVSRLFPRATKLLRTGAVEGVGDRRVRSRAVDARRRVAVRGGRAGERVEVDRGEHLLGAARAVRAVLSPDLYDVLSSALFLDATFLAVRPDGPKEGVLVAWGFTDQGERVLLAVMLGMRESYEDWQALGRDLIGRGLGAPMLIVADGAPGLIKAIEQCWPRLTPTLLRAPGSEPVREAARPRARTRQARVLAGAR